MGVAIGGDAGERPGVPGGAAQDAWSIGGGGFGAFGVFNEFAVGAARRVFAPLPRVANHIVEAEAIGLEAFAGCRVDEAVVPVEIIPACACVADVFFEG